MIFLFFFSFKAEGEITFSVEASEDFCYSRHVDVSVGEKWNRRRVSVFPPLDVSSKCCLASEAAREAQFGEGCHLEGARSAVMTPPPRAHAGAVSSTAATSLSLHLCATLHTSSHTSSSHLPAAFLLAASKPDAPVLEGRGGGSGTIINAS